MKRFIILLLLTAIIFSLTACSASEQAQVVATTLPVYTFTEFLCRDTDITVAQLITADISCLHDYTLQVYQMQLLERSDIVIYSGAGLEDFMHDVLDLTNTIDASTGITLLCPKNSHNHDGHSRDHQVDPHIWLSPVNAKIMAENICNGLIVQFPEHRAALQNNLAQLSDKLDALYNYGLSKLFNLRSTDMITFHDGFSYFADCFHLNILHAVEEESGSEAAAEELIHLICLVEDHELRCVFTETNGSTAAAGIVATETGVPVFTLDMAISGSDYFDIMYRNIDTVKEALG